ncbi:MAG: DMT family transporter, partial [Clostridiales bacterium]
IAMIPIATLISARLFLKEKHTLLQVLAVVVSVGGVVLIAFTGADGNFAAEPMGYLLLLVAVLAAAAYQILVKFKDNLYTAMEMVFGIALYGLIFYGSCGIIEAAVTNNFYRLILLPFDQPLVLLLVIALAMVSTIGAFCLFNYAISAIGPTRCSVFAGVMSVTSIICGIVVLDEVLSISQLCGALMVILGAWAANHFIYRETAEDQVEKISAPNKDEMRVG